MDTRPPFEYYKEYYRLYAVLYATDEGLFKEVPDDLSSAQIGIEVVYRICLGTDGGEVRVIDFYNAPAMDKDRQTGGPVMVDDAEWYVEPGDSTTPLVLIRRVSGFFDEDGLARLSAMHAVAEIQEGILP
jgi:hypothetical protein